MKHFLIALICTSALMVIVGIIVVLMDCYFPIKKDLKKPDFSGMKRSFFYWCWTWRPRLTGSRKRAISLAN